MTRRFVTITLLVAYVGAIVAANWAVTVIPPLPLGFRILVPAGVWFVAVDLTLRDLLHDRIGSWWTIVAILAGAMLSWPLAGPTLALAASMAFLGTQLVDLAVYALVRKSNRRWVAVALSNAVGLVVDSMLFIGLAQGFFRSLGLDPTMLFIGQVIGKAAVTAVTAALIWFVDNRRALRLRESAVAA